MEKKYSNVKLLLSQKMEELDYSRKSITSLERTVTDLQVGRQHTATYSPKHDVHTSCVLATSYVQCTN